MAIGNFLYLSRMRLPFALLLLASACGFPGAPGSDASMDSPPSVCVPGFVNVCGLTPRNSDFVVGSTEINTGTDSRCQVVTPAGGQEICVFYYNKIEVQNASTLLAYGSRPFALVAKDTIRIRGKVDVSSRLVRPADRQRGAGSGPPAALGLCSFASDPETSDGGGAGGAGGTLATQGANGGVGDTDSSGSGSGNAVGGTPGRQLALLTMLRGGCDGQNGAPGVGPTGATGGLGGGAVYLSAASMQIAGDILAGGSGGATAPDDEDGGSGGGSGGVIVLESASIAISGLLLATGGGGGRGANTASTGAPGSDATSAAAAPGGSAGNGGGLGGAGAASTAAVSGVSSSGGGGGGGGGVGFILLRGTDIDRANATIVPSAGLLPLPI